MGYNFNYPSFSGLSGILNVKATPFQFPPGAIIYCGPFSLDLIPVNENLSLNFSLAISRLSSFLSASKQLSRN